MRACPRAACCLHLNPGSQLISLPNRWGWPHLRRASCPAAHTLPGTCTCPTCPSSPSTRHLHWDLGQAPLQPSCMQTCMLQTPSSPRGASLAGSRLLHLALPGFLEAAERGLHPRMGRTWNSESPPRGECPGSQSSSRRRGQLGRCPSADVGHRDAFGYKAVNLGAIVLPTTHTASVQIHFGCVAELICCRHKQRAQLAPEPSREGLGSQAWT